MYDTSNTKEIIIIIIKRLEIKKFKILTVTSWMRIGITVLLWRESNYIKHYKHYKMKQNK